jgi:hypothetical protein
MINLTDVTFMIPLKVESDDRLIVTKILVSYLLKHFNTNILICEQGEISHAEEFTFEGKVDYIFDYSNADLFHKTRLLNLMIESSKTPIVVSQDSDVFLFPHQYENAANVIRQKLAYFCYPFNEPTHQISRGFYRQLFLVLDLKKAKTKVESPLVPPGGCFFMDKQKFTQCGLENENFISWGAEDAERKYRILKLGYEIHSCSGKLFHLKHKRTLNSSSNHSMYQSNELEYEKVKSMTKKQLVEYICSWKSK